MKTLIDTLIMGIYALTVLWGSHYSLKTIHDKVQMMALEKAAQGLGSMEKMTQTMTGKKLNF